MTKPLTTEQHQLLEDLTGKQYTRSGIPRKIPRSLRQTLKLGLVDRNYQKAQARHQVINQIKKANPGYDSDQIQQQALAQGHEITKLHIMLASICSVVD